MKKEKREGMGWRKKNSTESRIACICSFVIYEATTTHLPAPNTRNTWGKVRSPPKDAGTQGTQSGQDRSLVTLQFLQVCVTGSLSATSEIWALTLSGTHGLPEGESSMFWAHGHRAGCKTESFKLGPHHGKITGGYWIPWTTEHSSLTNDWGGEVSALGEACLVLACAFVMTPTHTHQP